MQPLTSEGISSAESGVVFVCIAALAGVGAGLCCLLAAAAAFACSASLACSCSSLSLLAFASACLCSSNSFATILVSLFSTAVTFCSLDFKHVSYLVNSSLVIVSFGFADADAALLLKWRELGESSMVRRPPLEVVSRVMSP